MNVGIGLPIGDPATLLTLAQRADAGPFSTLGLLDRLVYANPEPLVALAVLTGATSRIRVQTEVLLAPLRDTALLARQAATLDRMTGGRLWSGEPYGDGSGPIGPAPARPGRPEVLFDGFKPAAIERVARWGDGFLAAAPPSWAVCLFETARRFWKEYERDGEPRIVAQVNVALGPDDVVHEAQADMHAYYTYTGMADRMVAGMLTTPAEIRDAIAGFTDLGADEVMLHC
ncbi:LLM class flavin-dependent oxidoreductase [Streptomyces sp. NPDC102441]|uniref:LLM class flavin-dependent oxidoreductase n=1 Tax=Streptomyces sp. NPDC102441 TaxID=3366176 RepID=UPI0037FB845D